MLQTRKVENFYNSSNNTKHSESELKNTVADQLVRYLASNGINTYFGIPGGSIEPFFNALAREERRGNAKFVLTRSEAAAGFAADGYYRSSGKIGVCTGTAGPGISNLLTSIMSAHADRIPLLIIVPEVTSSKLGRGALQDTSCDGHSMVNIFSECTKYCSVITAIDQIGYKVKKALIQAWTPPMGPVYLAIPTEMLSASEKIQEYSFDKTNYDRKTLIDHQKTRHLVNQLASDQAKKVIFYIGDDAGARVNELNQISDFWNAKIVATPAGKRWVNHFSNNYLGVAGFSGSKQALDALQNADTVICLGATYDELSTNAWTVFNSSVDIYSIDSHSDFSYRIDNVIPILSHPDMFVSYLLKNTFENKKFSKKLEYENKYYNFTDYLGSLTAAVHPHDLMSYFSRFIPDEIVIHLDVGNTFSWSTNYLLRREIDTYRVSMGLSTMCWSVSSIIGACISSKKRSICMVGDGAMLMSSLELTVAVENNLPITYIILNDSCLGMVRHGQALAKAENFAHNITAVNFSAIAHAVGAAGIKITRLEELLDMPQTWLADNDNGPCVIDVTIDRDAIPPMADRVAGLASGIPK